MWRAEKSALVFLFKMETGTVSCLLELRKREYYEKLSVKIKKKSKDDKCIRKNKISERKIKF